MGTLCELPHNHVNIDNNLDADDPFTQIGHFAICLGLQKFTKATQYRSQKLVFSWKSLHNDVVGFFHNGPHSSLPPYTLPCIITSP